ncbi:hypothetical protein BELL_0052g00280 [Botrytis elliptica]|uniref:Uncharacterized protein n=1 Tax=Botrytis elliptica TaxID=278938 RepID=A0A4Z1KCD2_9HELO|nr:hypothetical protein BELL_0052g00280 [Botrytis elliptica]
MRASTQRIIREDLMESPRSRVFCLLNSRVKHTDDQANSPDASTVTDIPDFKIRQIKEIHTHLAINGADSWIVCIFRGEQDDVMDETQAHFDVAPNRWIKERNISLTVPLKGQQRKHEKSTREPYRGFLDRQTPGKESRNDSKESSTSKSERRGKRIDDYQYYWS